MYNKNNTEEDYFETDNSGLVWLLYIYDYETGTDYESLSKNPRFNKVFLREISHNKRNNSIQDIIGKIKKLSTYTVRDNIEEGNKLCDGIGIITGQSTQKTESEE